MSFPHGSSRHRLAQGLRGLLSDQGCRLGRAALACALLSTSGCQGSIGRATLTMAEAAPTALQALVDQETHGESHPNNVLPFLASEEGGRSLQAISEEDARPEAPSAAPIQVKVNADAELLIRDPKVVDDPVRTNGKGAWSFATLMTRLAGRQDPAEFTLAWLRSWERNQIINGDTSAARAEIRSRVIAPWLRASGGKRLDLNKAPFRLLAIVNRLDLRSTGNAGEGRFIFGVVDSLGQPLAFTVILEYGVPLARVGSVQAWASRWHKLAALPLGSPAYNQALQDITDTFSAAGANPAKPNGSALNQLRTNELAIGSSWELREFQISRQSGLLAQVTVKQTPKQALNNSKELASFLKANAAAVLAGRHVVPPAMLAAGNQATFDWQAPGVDEKVRKAFAVATCNGCHTTDAFFLHVGTRQRGQAAPLSDFVTRTELPARARDLAKLLR